VNPPPDGTPDPAGTPGRSLAAGVDREAVGRGAMRALAVVLPAALVQLLVGDPSLRLLLFMAVLAGFGAGGHRAARIGPAAPFTNAALAALVAFGLAQVIGLVAGVASGGGVPTPVRVAFLGLLATSCGMVGAWVALRRGAPSPGAPSPEGGAP